MISDRMILKSIVDQNVGTEDHKLFHAGTQTRNESPGLNWGICCKNNVTEKKYQCNTGKDATLYGTIWCGGKETRIEIGKNKCKKITCFREEETGANSWFDDDGWDTPARCICMETTDGYKPGDDVTIEMTLKDASQGDEDVQVKKCSKDNDITDNIPRVVQLYE